MTPSAPKTGVGGVWRLPAVVGLVIGLHPEAAPGLGVVDGRGGVVAVPTDGDQAPVMIDRLENKTRGSLAAKQIFIKPILRLI